MKTTAFFDGRDPDLIGRLKRHDARVREKYHERALRAARARQGSQYAALAPRPTAARGTSRAHRCARRVASTASGGASDDGGSGSTEPPLVGACSGAETLGQLAPWLSALALAVRAGVFGAA